MGFRERWAIVDAALGHPWVKWGLRVLAAVGFWDLLGAQLLPKWLAEKMPRFYDVLSYTTGWLPFSAWLWIATLVLAGSAIEYAYRRGKPEPASLTPSRVPLLEAATQTYEQTQGTLVASVAEIRIGNEDRRKGTLTWYCYALADRLSIYGNWPPSRVSEKIEWREIRNRFSFDLHEGALILREHHTKDYYENLEVDAAELRIAITEVRALVPTLKFVWAEDRGKHVHIGKDRSDLFLIVHNLSTTVTAKGVYVVREWMMRTENRKAGGLPQRDEVRLPLQFSAGDTADIEPGGEERYRLCTVVNDTEENAGLLVPSSKNPLGYNAGSGSFQFQVVARAQNASSAPDLYEIEAGPGGLGTTRKTEGTIDV